MFLPLNLFALLLEPPGILACTPATISRTLPASAAKQAATAEVEETGNRDLLVPAAHEMRGSKVVASLLRVLASSDGVMYAIGQGVEKYPAEALKWFRKATEQGGTLVSHHRSV